jgi:hypothetical protein
MDYMNLVCILLTVIVITLSCILIFNDKKDINHLNSVIEHHKKDINAFNGIIKVINVTNSIPITDNNNKTVGWEIDDGYPTPIIFQYVNTLAPDWVQKLKSYDKVFISTVKPLSGPYETAVVRYPKTLTASPQPFGWVNIDSKTGLENCCVDSKGNIDYTKFTAKYGNPQIHSGWVYALGSPDKSRLFSLEFWLGVFNSDKTKPPVPPIAPNTTMYIFPSSENK